MKRIVIAIATLTLLCAPASAQGFLDRIRKQVEETIGNTARDEAEDNIPDNVRTGMDRADGSMQMVTGEQALPPRRYSTFGWDGPVTPSSAKFPIPLMNEFPAVPSAKELANPTEANQIAYYKAIKAVTLRAEELNQDTTCEDQETLLWREKSNKMLKETFGLTDEEIAMLERDDLTEEEQERLNDKMTRALLGDIDTDALQKEADELEGKSQDEVVDSYMDKSQKATFEVYDRNAADIKKYMGVTAEEMKAASRAQYQYRGDGQCPEMTALQKKTEAYQKEQSAKDPNFRKEADAFQKKMQSESLKALQGSSALGGLLGSIGKATQKVSPIVEMEQKMATYVAQMQKLMWVPDSEADARFSASDRRKLESIKEKIYSTDDPSVYNPLFAEASELISTYRERAAKVWADDVQKRFNAMKENLPELIKLNRQAVEDELIPECALWRMPLNYVVSAGDVLAEAYSEFPANYPPMYQEEVIREVPLSKVPGSYATAWFPEFSVFGAAHFDDIKAGKYIFASNGEGEVYQFNSGSWTKLSDKRIKELSEMKQGAAAAGGSWTSQDGKRTVTFNGEGGYIALPEGDEIFQPHAWKASSNKIEWIYQNPTEDGKIQLVLCTYKL